MSKLNNFSFISLFFLPWREYECFLETHHSGPSSQILKIVTGAPLNREKCSNGAFVLVELRFVKLIILLRKLSTLQMWD